MGVVFGTLCISNTNFFLWGCIRRNTRKSNPFVVEALDCPTNLPAYVERCHSRLFLSTDVYVTSIALRVAALPHARILLTVLVIMRGMRRKRSNSLAAGVMFGRFILQVEMRAQNDKQTNYYAGERNQGQTNKIR